jgi:hypothetical protein
MKQVPLEKQLEDKDCSDAGLLAQIDAYDRSVKKQPGIG